MANYVGSELKFAINLTADGFSMDADDFDVEVKSTRNSVKGNKAGTIANDGKLVIFRDPESGGTGTWYGILDTDGMAAGNLTVVATAHIVDAKAFDGIRKEIAVASLGRIENP